jgi:hypothetical protein
VICKLCQQEKPLLNSHLIPRAFYKLLRTPGLENPNPIIADGETTRATQDQMAQPLFCAECEDRLNKNGESWVLSKGYRLKGPSVLYEALSAATPVPAFQSGTVYSALSIPQIDLDKLVYFGASIFWRSSVADWALGRKTTELMRLGSRYEEDFRKYLYGVAEFPVNAAIWVAVVRSEHPAPVISYPTGERVRGYHRHTFDVLGLSYMLHVGNRLPEDVRRLCGARSPSRYLFFTNIDRILDRNARRAFCKSPPSRKLAALRDKHLSGDMPPILREQLEKRSRGE